MSNIKCQNLYLPIFFLVLFFNSCSEEPSIPEEKFIKVYVDLLIIQDTTTIKSPSIDSLKNDVYSRNNIKSEEYLNTLEYYKSYPEKWEGIFEKATAYAEKLRDESAKKP
jgi:hypothetical protein